VDPVDPDQQHWYLVPVYNDLFYIFLQPFLKLKCNKHLIPDPDQYSEYGSSDPDTDPWIQQLNEYGTDSYGFVRPNRRTYIMKKTA